jgi:hypothetical protein
MRESNPRSLNQRSNAALALLAPAPISKMRIFDRLSRHCAARTAVTQLFTA